MAVDYFSEWIIVNSTELVASFFTTCIRIFVVAIQFEQICLHSYSLVMYLM